MRARWILSALLVAGCTSTPTGIGPGDNGQGGGNGVGGGGSIGSADMNSPSVDSGVGGGNGGGGIGGNGGGSGGGTCAHDTCTAGVALTPTCDACVAQVCSSDSYCCTKSWNARCVTEAASVCSCSGTGGGGTGGSGGGGGSGGAGGSGGSTGTGGNGSMLKFAVFGDCRPPNPDQTSAYPSTIVGGIFTLAQSNGAQFTIGTGDYMFATQASSVTAQVQLFQTAMANYTAGPVYLTMGNHECTGATASNCPNLNETPNVQAYMKLLPSGITTPYYRIDMMTPMGSAKFVFIAANAWSTAQSTWLTTQLAEATTYTFVMRHESTQSSGVPSGVPASEAIVAAHPYTLELLGHSHEYSHVDTQHVISGNGGAPLDSGTSYGLLLVEQQATGNITVNEIDEATGSVSDTWSVTPAGAKAP